MSKKPAIRFDTKKGSFYQGDRYLGDMPPLERSLLQFFSQNPNVELTKTKIVENVWPKDVARDGVSDDAIYRLIGSTRKRLARHAPHAKYIYTWRGYPEGGYRFVPHDGTPPPPVEQPLELPLKVGEGDSETAVLRWLVKQVNVLARDMGLL